MTYTAVLLDLDNTLYKYNPNHKKSMDKVRQYCIEHFNISEKEFLGKFKKARKQTHINLNNTASSHNRVLYFQGFLELLGVNSLDYALQLYNIYWDTFLENMMLIADVEEALIYWKSKGIKLCILTDLTTHIQLRKIKKLGLEKYIDFLVTSEQVGHEKPHAYMFHTALEKLGVERAKTIMIGDSWDKDIVGAKNFGIQSIWFTESTDYNNEIDNVTIFKAKTFNDIRKII